MVKVIVRVSKQIYKIADMDSNEMAEALIRIQERYESSYSQLYNKLFSKSDALKAKIQSEELGDLSLYTGGNTYDSPVGGYNFPGYALKPFIMGLLDLSAEEQDIVDILKYVKGKFYVIGVPDDADSSVEKHELAHALWYLDKEYKENVTNILNSLAFSQFDAIHITLTNMGYNEEVFLDEMQAYLCADYESFMRSIVELCPDTHISSKISLKIQIEYYKALKRQGFSLKE